jgi:hypothetical protein
MPATTHLEGKRAHATAGERPRLQACSAAPLARQAPGACAAAAALAQGRGYIGVERPKVQDGRVAALGEAGGRVRDAYGTGRRLSVAEGALAGRQGERRDACASAGASEHGRQGADLDRVAQARARAVHADARHVAWRQAGGLKRSAQHLLLRRAIGRSQPAAAAVLVHSAAGKQGQRLLGGVGGAAAALQQQHADGLCAHVAVCCGVERLAAPVGRQHAWGGGRYDRSTAQ